MRSLCGGGGWGGTRDAEEMPRAAFVGPGSSHAYAAQRGKLRQGPAPPRASAVSAV